jgi:hypothetical protein
MAETMSDITELLQEKEECSLDKGHCLSVWWWVPDYVG